MKPNFHHRLINRRFEDPCLYVRLLRERRAFLFDIGFIGSLESGDLQKITDIFVTHMHIDHFTGFDTLLRAILRREIPLRVYGPEGIIECVEGKLNGYTWNLIKEYPLKIEVFGISEKELRHSSFYSQNGFRRIDMDRKAFRGIVLQEPCFCISASNLSHGIPCLGFSLTEDIHINIDKAGLNKMGLPVGPWLTKFKELIREKAPPDRVLSIDSREIPLSELMHIAMLTDGQKISYLTDISPDEENISKAIELVKDSDTLYCEAYYLHEELGRAMERSHLTAKTTGEIARRANVKNLVLMHLSPKYRDNSDLIEEEAMKEYRGEE